MEGFYKFDGENWYYDYISVFLIVFAIAFFTEIYDEFFKSKFDLLDLIATQLGFFLALLIKLIIYFFN